MREPAFWHRQSSWQARLLKPAGALYGAITARRMLRHGLDAGIPVICVGNYHVGGAGKTPTTMAVAAIMRDLGANPVVLSRGYGGQLRGPVAVDAAHHSAADVGDEPLMMATRVPVVVARERPAGVTMARSMRGDVIIMDDGFQNPSIIKDLSLIVVDGRRAVGNGQIFPAGPLRAPLAVQLPRTDALIVIGEGNRAAPIANEIRKQRKPVLSARLVADQRAIAAIRGRPVLAFAGIGDPGRFFRTLRENGVDVVQQHAFDDHHAYTPAEIERLRSQAQRHGLVLVTTEKDRARLLGRLDVADTIDRIIPFVVTLVFDDPAEVRSFLARRLEQARRKKVRGRT